MAPRASRPARSLQPAGAPTIPTQGDNGETFDLNVSSGSDSDSDEDDPQPQARGRRRTTASTVPTQPVNQQVNNPDIPEKKTTAHDIKYFFESHGDESVVCKVCK
jgi:hypothetical protein